MASVPKSAGRIGGRQTPTAALLIVWLGVIVVGAGPTADANTWIGVPRFEWLNYVFAALVIIGAALIVASLIMVPRREGFEPRKRRPIWPYLIVAGLFLLLYRRPRSAEEGTTDPSRPIEPVEPTPSAGPDRGSGVGGQELLVLAVMLAVAIGVVLWSRRRLDSGGVAEDEEVASLERAFGPALERAAEHLLTGTDPRSAVLMAYRSLETVLEKHGVPRQRSETPAEHLVRVLADLPLDTAPLVTLSQLYEEARFSAHPITADHQQSAAAALDQVRRQLSSAPTTRGDNDGGLG